jgi:hypothetical protein
MILDAKSGVRGVLLDLTTGQPIKLCQWADTDTGEYRTLQMGPDGRALRGPNGKPVLKANRGRIRFIPTKPLSTDDGSAVGKSAPLAELAREVLKGKPPKVTPLVFVPGTEHPECEERFCHRPAAWEVSREQEVEPERMDNGHLAERAVTTEVHRWCEWHYRPPRFVSLRGVESEVEVRARPQ